MVFDFKFVVLFLSLTLANTVEAITGFGGTIICVTISANFYDIDFLVPILVPVNIVISAYLVARYRKHLDMEEFLHRMLPVTLLGLGLGFAIFYFAGTNVMLKVFYGVFVICFAVVELIRFITSKGDTALSPLKGVKAFFWLLFGGTMQGLYASGGPPLVYYSNRTLPNKAVFRCTLSAIWLVLNIILLILHISAGKLTMQMLPYSAVLMAALLIGIIVGEYLHNRISEHWFRGFVLALLLMAGLSLFLGSASQYWAGR